MKSKVYLAACLILAIAAICTACGAPAGDIETTRRPAEKIDVIVADNAPAKAPAKVPLTVRYVSGEAYVIRDGEKNAIEKDGHIYEGDEIHTGSDGLVILKLESAKQLHIAENTHFSVSALRLDEDGEVAEFSLERGNVVSVINKELGAAERYEIETPELIMAIRGTIVSVDYNPDTVCSRTTFFEGKGVISSKINADVAEVSAGESAETHSGKIERADAQPVSLNPAEQRFLFDDGYRALLDEQDAEMTFLRLEAILSKQAFIEAKRSYNHPSGKASDTAGSASDNPQVSGDTPAATDTFSLESAKARFSELHPEADITVAKREGNVHYVEGRDGATIYKMKFEADNGEIVLDLTIETGRR